MRSDSVRTDTGKIEGFRGRRHGMLVVKRKHFRSQQRIDVSSLLSGSSDWDYVLRTSDHLHPDPRREPRSRRRVGNHFTSHRSLLSRIGSRRIVLRPQSTDLDIRTLFWFPARVIVRSVHVFRNSRILDRQAKTKSFACPDISAKVSHFALSELPEITRWKNNGVCGASVKRWLANAGG